jgi:hypothetical protein
LFELYLFFLTFHNQITHHHLYHDRDHSFLIMAEICGMGRASTVAYLRPVTVGVSSPGALRLQWSRVKTLADLSAKAAVSAASGPQFAADVVEFSAPATRLSAEISPFVVTVGA